MSVGKIWTPWDDPPELEKPKDGLDFDEDQVAALAALEAGESALLTGVAGTGKSYVINELIKRLRRNGKSVAVTASTGIAATHLSGQTVHSWTGVGVSRKSSLDITLSANWNRYRQPAIERADVLIIEEVSMIDGHLLDLIEEVCSLARITEDGPFGGLQVIFCGDFGQLPPVEAEEHGFCFQSKTWREHPPRPLVLRKVHRQESAEFVEILRQVRNSEITETSIAAIKARVRIAKTGLEWGGIRIMTHNAQVDQVNRKALRDLLGEEHVYTAQEEGLPWALEQLEKNCLSPRELRLKTGSRVMFTRNHPDRLYANGTMGTVASLARGFIAVDLDRPAWNGVKRILSEHAEWKVQDREDDERPLAVRRQYPLRLAHAITVHKSQGCTFDRASMNIANCFAPGQGYVALSRVRGLEGLNLESWNGMKSFQTSDAVKAFMKEHGI